MSESETNITTGKNVSEVKVTVIIPAYNAAKWLAECLDSIVNQTSSQWRAIVVDDGSTDSSPEVAGDYVATDSRIQLLRRAHEGVSASRNAGLELVETEWVMFLDADDLLSKNAVENLIHVAEATCSDIVVGGITSDKKAILSGGTCFKAESITSHEALRRLLSRKGIEASMCGVLYRRSLFDYPARLRFRKGRYEDLDLGYQIIDRAKQVAVSSHPQYYYREHDESFINTFNEHRVDALTVTDHMFEYFKGTEFEKLAADRRFGAHYNILLSAYTHKKTTEELKRRCFEVIKNYRRDTLFGKGIRLKNRMGALASYGGLPMIRLLAKIFPQK